MRERSVSERRLVNRLLSYWKRIQGDKAVPPIHKFSNEAVADLWDFCFCVRIEGRVRSSKSAIMYTYTHMGRELQGAMGKNMVGKTVSSRIRSLHGISVLKQLDACLQAEEPIQSGGQFVSHESKVVKYRMCALPFGKEKGHITHIVVGLSWRSF